MSQSCHPNAPAGAKRLLIAEDDEAIRMYIEIVLAEEGYHLVLVDNGEAAVRQYREQGPFDLAILDVHMPLLDGLGALQQIRALHPVARGLVLSGTPLEGDRAVPEWAQGFDGFLCKPFDPSELVHEVRRLLGKNA
jgi:DNA-binding response OmpR family regulator